MLLSQSLCTVFHYQSFTSFTWKPSPSSNISTIIFQPLIVIKLSYRCTKLTGIKGKRFNLSLSACSFHHWLPEFTHLLSEALTTPNTVIMQTIHLFYVLFNSKKGFLYLHVQYALWQTMKGFTWRSCIPWKKFVTLIGTNWPRSWSVLHQWEEYDAQCEAGKPLPLYEKQNLSCVFLWIGKDWLHIHF